MAAAVQVNDQTVQSIAAAKAASLEPVGASLSALTSEQLTAKRVASLVAQYMQTNYPALADEPASDVERDITMYYARKAVRGVPPVPALPRITPLANRPTGMTDPVRLAPPTPKRADSKGQQGAPPSYVIDLDRQAGQVVAFHYDNHIGVLDVDKAREEILANPPHYSDSDSVYTAVSHCVVYERSMVDEEKRQAAWARKFYMRRIGVVPTGLSLLRESVVRGSATCLFASASLVVVDDETSGTTEKPFHSAATAAKVTAATVAALLKSPSESPRVDVHADAVRQALADMSIAARRPGQRSAGRSATMLLFHREKRKAAFARRRAVKQRLVAIKE